MTCTAGLLVCVTGPLIGQLCVIALPLVGILLTTRKR